MYPEVAVSPNGRHALVSWTGNYLTVDAMTLMASTRTKAGTWTRPKRAIPTDATYKPSTRQPPPVIDNHGTATVAWVEVERVPTPEGHVFPHPERHRLARWSLGAEELYRGVPRAYASNVSLATSPDGELLVAITIGGSDEQLLTRRRSASGAWAAPVTAYLPSPETTSRRRSRRSVRTGAAWSCRRHSSRPARRTTPRSISSCWRMPWAAAGTPKSSRTRWTRPGRPRGPTGPRRRAEGRYRGGVAVPHAGSAWPARDRAAPPG